MTLCTIDYCTLMQMVYAFQLHFSLPTALSAEATTNSWKPYFTFQGKQVFSRDHEHFYLSLCNYRGIECPMNAFHNLSFLSLSLPVFSSITVSIKASLTPHHLRICASLACTYYEEFEIIRAMMWL